MPLKYPVGCSFVVIVMIASYISCEYSIRDCQKYREIYEAFSSCALSSMFGGTGRYEFEQLSHINEKDALNKDDFLLVVNYWCNVLALASTCTDGKALHCSNRDQIHFLVSNTGGLCQNGRIKDEFEFIVPQAFSFDTKCNNRALDIIETCEDRVPETGYDVNIEDGIDEMTRNIEKILRCNANGLRQSSITCVSSRDSVLMYTFRTLSYSVPHALGIDLNVTKVMDIIDE